MGNQKNTQLGWVFFLVYQCCPKSQITLIFLVPFIKVVAIAFNITTSTNTLNHTVLSKFCKKQMHKLF